MQRLTTLLLIAGITFTTQAQTDCGLPHDINNNGSVDIEDFLSILGLFGDQDSDGDGLYDSQDGCTDSVACNYSDVNAQSCLFADAIGFCGGCCQYDFDEDGICDPHDCGQPITYQGYDYSTVLIGDQCWFAENLRSEFYRNGEAIPSELSDSEWESTTVGACAESWSLDEYGRVYNWYAADDVRSICPCGWHVPSDDEWTEMVEQLGGQNEAGNQLKSATGWGDNDGGTNSSGFTGLPGGFRYDNGIVNYSGANSQLGGWFWSSTTEGGTQAIYRALFEGIAWIYTSDWSRQSGISVRCIQDSEE